MEGDPSMTDNGGCVEPEGRFVAGQEWNAVERVILERRSIRKFKGEPLPDAMIRRILEAGRFAPSAGNCQPWKFIVVRSPQILAEMEKDAVRMAKLLMWLLDYTRSRPRRVFLAPFAKLVIRLLPNQLHPVPFGLLQQIARDKTPVFHGAPTIVLLLEDRRGVSSPSLDVGICGENMVLAAHSLGAGTCWLGMVKLLTYYPKWRRLFGIKYPYRLNDGIALGWPAGKYDGHVPREVQLVQWLEGGPEDRPRLERQGE
jgi:nitroreductase